MSRLGVRRWRGLVMLTRDAVVATSCAVERVHLATARWPFGALEAIPGAAVPAAVVHAVHDATVTWVHAVIRVSVRAVGGALDVGLGVAERRGGDGCDAGVE